MKYNYENIGKRIAKERKEYCHFTQDDLLLNLSRYYGVGMCRNTLSAIENGKYHDYDIDFLIALCELFNCEMGYLLCEYDEKRRIKADIKETTGLESDVIDIILSMKHSFLKLSLLNDLLKNDYFLAIIDLLHIVDYHKKKCDELENKIVSDHKSDETLEEEERLQKRHDKYTNEYTLHKAKAQAYRYSLTVAFSRLLDKRYGPLPDIDTSNSESKWKQENHIHSQPIIF